jgi:N-acetylglucosaminyldiphosphoundecaprenol N-acetyl-beta-D-mannosaminyltransferase
MSFRISTASLQTCIGNITEWIESDDGPKYLVCANPHSLVTATRDPLFERAIKGADLVVPDGIGVVWASRLLGGRIQERVTGTDIFLALNRALSRNNHHSYYFLGSSESTLRKIVNRMEKDFPSIAVAGVYSPPFEEEFSDQENSSMIHAVNGAKPDVLWVGMTAPKQEKWISQNKDKLNVKFIGAIGAAFDYYAGTVKRPRPWFLDHGLEWLPRLLGEPCRLRKRMFISAPLFMTRILAERISRNR